MDKNELAISIVKEEKSAYENPTTWITEDVAFEMREVIRTCRKNYYGIFEKPTDSVTGKDKIFHQLTKRFVDSVIKNIDLDTKDINFRAKHPDAIGTTSFIRNLAKNWLDEVQFGEYLDEFISTLAIDGTAVWKTLNIKDEKTKEKRVEMFFVDLLNIYIDPTARSIQDAYRFTERAVLTTQEIKAMDWDNTDVDAYDNVAKSDPSATQVGSSNDTVKGRDVYECWGKFPLSLFTEDEEDMDTEIEGHIIVSGIDIGDPKVHLIEKNPSGLKPYEEARYTKVPGRWYGEGVAEKLISYQTYLNTLFNLRVNRHYVSSLGLFKIRKGSGVTPQMLKRLASNGAIEVSNMEDIEQWPLAGPEASAYSEEQLLVEWGKALTSAHEAATGEALPASTPATNAVLQQRGAQSAFVFIKKGIGLFLQRWMKRHTLPMLIENMKKDEFVRIAENTQIMREIAEKYVMKVAEKELKRIQEEGKLVDEAQVQKEIVNQIDKLINKPEFFLPTIEDIDITKFDVQVFVTNEEFDKAVVGQNLIQALQLKPEYGDVIIRQLFDLMGLDSNTLKPDALGAIKAQPQQQQPIQQNPATPQQIGTNANVPA